MPELPEMQALSERLAGRVVGRSLSAVASLGFSALKTVRPAPDDLLGAVVVGVSRRAKYLVFSFEGGERLLVHLSQAGRLDIELPPKATRAKGSVVRLTFSAPGEEDVALLVREYGRERRAAWWVLAPGDDGPLSRLGPEPGDPAFARFIGESADNRRLNSLLRDQGVVAGIGRGYADDILNAAGLSPFASLRGLRADERRRLLDAVATVLEEALGRERQRAGGLSEAKLGLRFAVHNRAGEPCPRCQTTLRRVSFESYEMVYCPSCQTGGRELADRRLSRLLR